MVDSDELNFDILLGRDTEQYQKLLRNEGLFDLCTRPVAPADALSIFRAVYEKDSRSPSLDYAGFGVPPIIHQIWVGGRPVPEKYLRYQESVQTRNPDFQYHLWTDDKVRDLNLINQDLYDNAEQIVDKADLLRYELLYKFGGVYIDLDIECLRPLRPLHRDLNFYTCIAPLRFGSLIVNNAIVGAVKEHPILQACLSMLKERDYLDFLRSQRKEHGRLLPIFAGLHFTRAILTQRAALENGGVIFPPPFFYPEVGAITPHAYTIHYWDATWQS